MIEGILYTIWILVVLFFVLSLMISDHNEEVDVPAVFTWRRK
jgi:hypothetical protein